MGSVLWALAGVALGLGGLKFGVGMLRSLGSGLPAPPPPGEMRRINLRFRCSVCGVELKMTLAADEIPEPPRHCMEDMDPVVVE